MLIEQDLKLFNTSIIAEYIDNHYDKTNSMLMRECHVQNNVVYLAPRARLAASCRLSKTQSTC